MSPNHTTPPRPAMSNRTRATKIAARYGFVVASNGRDAFEFEVEASYPEPGRRIRESRDDDLGLSSFLAHGDNAGEAWASLIERIESHDHGLPRLYESEVG